MDARIKELDGLRGIAILMVLLWHYVANAPKDVEIGSWAEILSRQVKMCWSGVDLFFVLSGFFIGGILLDNHRAINFLKVFWIRRFFRIFPPFFMICCICFLFLPFFEESSPWLFRGLMPWWSYPTFSHIFFLSSNFGANFLGPAWSLSVEVHFYIIVSSMLLLFGRNVWLQSLLPLFFLSFFLRFVFPGFHTYVWVIFRLDTFFSGIFVAFLFRQEALWEELKKARYSFLFSWLLLVFSTFYIYHHRLQHSLLGVFTLSWFTLLYSLFLFVALLFVGSPWTAPLRSRFLVFWGSVSYSFYLYHQPISGALHGWLRGSQPSLIDSSAAWVSVLSAALSAFLAWLSFRTLERFFLSLGQRASYRFSDAP